MTPGWPPDPPARGGDRGAGARRPLPAGRPEVGQPLHALHLPGTAHHPPRHPGQPDQPHQRRRLIRRGAAAHRAPARRQPAVPHRGGHRRPPSSTSSTWSSSAWPATPSSPWATRRCWVGASSRGAPSSHYWSLPAGLDSLAPPALLARDIGHHFTIAVVEGVATAPHPLSPPPWPP